MERRLNVKTKAFTEADIKREFQEADAADVSSSILVTALPYLGRQHRLLALLVKTFTSVPRNGQHVWTNLSSTAARTCLIAIDCQYGGLTEMGEQSELTDADANACADADAVGVQRCCARMSRSRKNE